MLWPTAGRRGGTLLPAGLVTVLLAGGPAPAQVTERVSVSSDGFQSVRGSHSAAITPDGRFVAFLSESRELAPHDGRGVDVFIRDRRRDSTALVTERSGALAKRYVHRILGGRPALSADGRFVAFAAITKGSGRSDQPFRVFVRDMRAGGTVRLPTPDGRRTVSQNPQDPTISADGRYVAYVSESYDVPRGDPFRHWHAYVHDRRTGTTTRASAPPRGRRADGDAWPAQISADGRAIAFWSGATTLVPDDGNGKPDLFVRDLRDGSIVRATVSTMGEEAEHPERRHVARGAPSLSADGRVVAFGSVAGNLVPGDTNRVFDVFVRDLGHGTTERVSVTSEGLQRCWLRRFGRPCHGAASLSADGRFVAFSSRARTLVPGDTNRVGDVFVHDRVGGTTSRVSVGPAGQERCVRRRSGCSDFPVISGDGSSIAFESKADDMIAGDTNGVRDIFVAGGSG